ncbi:NnrS family protein [Malaciobacter halophilus]|nr:NnrS family protein [Malaciobacter halophilus]RYA24721.1 NnrS family protein [Malaciobacter halophilus]
MQKSEHYGSYPKNINPPIYLAYAFRIFFLILPYYIVLNIILWGFVYSGYLNLNFMDDILTWHIYEFLYGVGSAGICAFVLTAVPEFFKKELPVVDKKLLYIFIIWILGRVSFWFIDYIHIYIVAFLNCFLLLYTIYLVYKPFFKDNNQKHTSILICIITIFLIQVLFFLSYTSLININSFEILKFSLSFFMILILLVLRRVNMETVNNLLEKKDINKVFLAKSFRYNIAIFTIIIFATVSLFFPNNYALTWIAFACSFAILSLLNDYFIQEPSIFKSYLILSLISLILIMSLGYFSIGYAFLMQEFFEISNYIHFLTTGAFGLAFYLVMVVVSYVHTGRELVIENKAFLGALLIIFATILRVFFESQNIYLISTIFWASAFLIYSFSYSSYLLKKRVDNLPG